MQQRFDTRNYSIRDFEEWESKGELVLAAKFQRRQVWSDKARSFLLDTIIRGKPIPKIYMRQDTNPKTRRTTREIVDGQQRLHTVFLFLKDGFRISKTHNEDFGGKYFSQLDDATQRDILKYEFVVDLLQDMPDQEVHDVFARLNTYSITLNAQELRNARYFGEFKTCVYSLSSEFYKFWETNNIFTDKQILRMAEAEFVSELLIAATVGIRAKEKRLIDKFYKDYDDQYTGRKSYEKRFSDTIDAVGGIMGDTLPNSAFRATRLFYPLFCAIYHLKFELRELRSPRLAFRASDYPKWRVALEQVDALIERMKAAEDNPDEAASILSAERKFYDAYNEWWVHADRRKLMTEYICKLLAKALKD